MNVHVRAGLVVSGDDANGDVVAIWVDGMQPGPLTHRPQAALREPHWVLHLLGGGTPSLGVHVTESVAIAATGETDSRWARQALIRLGWPTIPADYHPVYRDGKVLGWAPPGDDYPISSVVVFPTHLR